MKYIGQFIQDFIARFRSDVYLENIADGTVANDKFLGLDSNNKIVKETVTSSSGDITGVKFITDSGAGSPADVASGSANFSILGGTGASVTNSSTTITISSEDSEIDHDSLSNFVAAEHVDWASASAGTIHSTNIPTLNQNTTGTAAGLSSTLAVSNGGTGATSLTDNAILLGNSTGAIEASSHLSYHTTGTNQDLLKIGDSSTTTAGITTDNSAQLNITVEGSTGTNAAGNDITFVAGTSTGNAAGGDFVFRSSPAGSSGTTVRASAEIAKLDNVGNLQIDGGLTVGSTSFVNSSGVVQVATQGTIDHDSLANFVANEHIDWTSSSAGTIHSSNIPTLNQDTTGSAATLTTTRAFQTDLASTSSANFDGSAANTHGVTGTLALGNGGTGSTTGVQSGKNYRIVNTSFRADIGTTKYYLPLKSQDEQTVLTREENQEVAVCDGRLVSLTWRAEAFNTHTGDATVTFGVETNTVGSSYSTGYSVQETESVTVNHADDQHLWHVVFDSAKHWDSTDMFTISMQSDTDITGSNERIFITLVIEDDWSTYLAGSTREIDSTP